MSLPSTKTQFSKKMSPANVTTKKIPALLNFECRVVSFSLKTSPTMTSTASSPTMTSMASFMQKRLSRNKKNLLNSILFQTRKIISKCVPEGFRKVGLISRDIIFYFHGVAFKFDGRLNNALIRTFEML